MEKKGFVNYAEKDQTLLRAVLKGYIPKGVNGVADWEWYNQSEGVVKWKLYNTTPETRSFVLFRNGYYFGDAFWPVYLANAEFNESFATSAAPLETAPYVYENGIPLALLKLPSNPTVLTTQKTASDPYVTAFLFTIPGKAEVDVLEGGFSLEMPPSGAGLFEVKLFPPKPFCVGYDPKQVVDWDAQTQTLMTGYLPNPKTFEVITAEPLPDVPTVAVFDDPTEEGECPSVNPVSCAQDFVNAAAALQAGNIDQAVLLISRGINCFLAAYPQKEDEMVKDLSTIVMKAVMKKLEKSL